MYYYLANKDYYYFKNISILKSILCSIHVTEIEYRYQNSDVQTVYYPFINIYIYTCMYDSDICTLCNLDTHGDEYHYVLICPFFKESIDIYIYYFKVFFQLNSVITCYVCVQLIKFIYIYFVSIKVLLKVLRKQKKLTST